MLLNMKWCDRIAYWIANSEFNRMFFETILTYSAIPLLNTGLSVKTGVRNRKIRPFWPLQETLFFILFFLSWFFSLDQNQTIFPAQISHNIWIWAEYRSWHGWLWIWLLKSSSRFPVASTFLSKMYDLKLDLDYFGHIFHFHL